MATKKFWEREDFSIQRFANLYREVYNLYYYSGEGTDEDERMDEGWALCQDAQNAPLLKAYTDYMDDIFTSDRELAAFAVTYGIYERVYNPQS